MTASHNLAIEALKSMGITDAAWVHGDGVERGLELPDIDAAGVFDIMDSFFGKPSVVVAGDWRSNKKVDVYDLVIRFAEDNYSRMRHEKMDAGMYVVIMSESLRRESTDC